MFLEPRFKVRRLVAVACAVLVVACAGTGEQPSVGSKQLTSKDIAGVTQGMTRAEVEQTLGPASLPPGRDKQGNPILTWRYSGQSGEAYRGYLYVTMDSASGKVIRIETYPPH